MFDGIKKAFEKLFVWLGDLLAWLVEAIAAIFKPIIDLFVGIGYFIFKMGAVLVEVLATLGSVAKLAFGLAQGLFLTLTGLDYDGTGAALPGSIAGAVSQLQPVFTALQFNKVGYVLIFSIWLFTAFAALKIINSFGTAGES